MHIGNNNIHFIGIGGIGMSGLADILMAEGYHVSGSDRAKSAITDYLGKRGALVSEGHDAKNVNQADVVIYSSAISKDNPEFVQAKKRGLPLIRRAELLGQLMNRRFGIAIAGTHGKTTSTSMLGEILVGAGLDPTLVIGGRLKSSMTNARLGKGELMVAEADEYDRSFLALNPRVAVITSIESDHLDIYAGLQDICDTFLSFARRLPFDGVLLVNAEDENIQKILPEIPGQVIRFGMRNGDIVAQNPVYKESGSSSDLFFKGKKEGALTLQVPGEHNIRNALAALGVAYYLNIPMETILEQLAAFKGVERRFDRIGEVNDILIIDDYGHHPTEIRETLKSAKKGWQRRVVAVFQPHLYSRTRDFYQEFAAALAQADLAVVTDIYPAREEPIAGVSGKLIYDALSKMDTPCRYIPELGKVPEELIELCKPGDMVITLGAGDINTAGMTLKKLLEQAQQ